MSTRKTAAKAAPKQVSVTLAKPHTHRGEQLPKGAQIQVRENLVPWLKDRGVIAKGGTQ